MIVFWISDESKKLSGTSKQLTNESPICILDDEDDDLENPVVIKDGSCDQDKIVKKKEKEDEFTVTQHKLSSVAGKQNLLKNHHQLPNDRKAKPEILDRKLSTNGKPMPVVEQPRKRKYKTKNITVPPGKPIKTKCVCPTD